MDEGIKELLDNHKYFEKEEKLSEKEFDVEIKKREESEQKQKQEKRKEIEVSEKRVKRTHGEGGSEDNEESGKWRSRKCRQQE